MTTALVIANGPTMDSDLETIGHHDMPVMVINRSGITYPGEIDYWCTYHPEHMGPERWQEQRAHNGGNTDYQVVGRLDVEKIVPSGSSTLLGVVYALTRYDRVIVAGAPLTGPYRYYRGAWESRHDRLKGRVFGVSGWIKQTFGGV